MFAHIALANNSVSPLLILSSTFKEIRLMFRMLLDCSDGSVILSVMTTFVAVMSMVTFRILVKSAYLEHGVPGGASQPISSSH